MDIDFTGEKLPTRRYINNFTRHMVPGGWYVRIIFTEFGFGAGGRGESALFLCDHEHSWQAETIKWEMIRKEPVGGIYRTKVPEGWLLLGTARGQGKTDDGTKYNCRTGSLVFVPDPGGEWQCKVLEEKDPYWGF